MISAGFRSVDPDWNDKRRRSGLHALVAVGVQVNDGVGLARHGGDHGDAGACRHHGADGIADFDHDTVGRAADRSVLLQLQGKIVDDALLGDDAQVEVGGPIPSQPFVGQILGLNNGDLATRGRHVTRGIEQRSFRAGDARRGIGPLW